MSEFVSLSASTLRTALVTYRSELLSLHVQYPTVYPHDHIAARVEEIDRALLTTEGNVKTVHISPATCNPNV